MDRSRVLVFRLSFIFKNKKHRIMPTHKYGHLTSNNNNNNMMMINGRRFKLWSLFAIFIKPKPTRFLVESKNTWKSFYIFSFASSFSFSFSIFFLSFCNCFGIHEFVNNSNSDSSIQQDIKKLCLFHSVGFFST